VWLRAGLAATAAVTLAVLTGVLELPSVGALLADLSDALGTWAYVLVPALAFFEVPAWSTTCALSQRALPRAERR
jgi:hypothetical protein